MAIEIQGKADLYHTLHILDEKTSNTKPLLRELTNHLVNIVEESFENERTPDGIAWSPIKPRKNDPHPEKILYAEGTMQGSLYSDVYNDGGVVGVNATAHGYPYPIVQQYGNKAGTLEAREFMPIKQDGEIYPGTVRELEQIVEDYFEFLDRV